MKAVFGGLLLAAAVAAGAKADPGPDPAPARTSASTASTRFHPAQVWGGIGFYNLSVSQCFFNVCGSASQGQFGFNGGGSYAFPVNPDMSWLGWGNIALAFGGGFTQIPLSAGAGIRGEHIGPVKLSGLLGLTVDPISNGGGTKVGLAFGGQGNYPLPQMPGMGVQVAIMYHLLTDSFGVFTINGGISYDLPY